MKIGRVCAAAALLSACAAGQVAINFGTIRITPLSSNSVSIRLDGNLPSPCYSDPVVATVSTNPIVISLNSVVSSLACPQVLVPFSKTVVVGPLAPGSYAVYAALHGSNGFVGEFTPTGLSVPLMPDVEGPITITPLSSNSVSIRLDGNLPTPCYSDPSVSTTVTGNSIVVSLNSVVLLAPCALVTVPFSKTVVVGPLAPGSYAITAALHGSNGFVGEFAPAGFSVPLAADVPAASLLMLLAIGTGLALLRYRLVRAG